jgi:hypothetical protein
VKLPGQVERGVFHGDSFYAVTGNGHLIAVDLKKQTVKDYGTLNTKLAPCIDVAGGQALVASSNKLHVVDLKSGKVVQTAPLMKEAVGLGFVGPSIFDSFICCGGDDRVFVQHKTSVTILDVVSGKVVAGIQLGDKEISFERGLNAHQKRGDRLIAVNGCNNNLTIIDLQKGKLVEQIKTPDWRIGGIQVAGDKVFLIGLRLGYGVWTQSFGSIDLKTGKYTSLALPSKMLRQSTLVAGPEGSMFMTGPDGTFHYDAQGKLIGPLSVKKGQVVGAWKGLLLVAETESLQLISTAAVTAKAR